MKRTRIILALFAIALCAPDSMAFVNRQVPALTTKMTTKTRKATTQRLSMVLDPTVLASTIAIPSSGSLTYNPFSALLDPSIEGEVLTDFAHVGLDLSTFVRPATALLRISVVIGRICAILSDLLPDGHMNPEEVVFQSLMLLVAMGACIQSLPPLFWAATANLSYRDGRAYANMFRKLGISWTQYKAMVATSLDWIQLEPHQELSDKDQDKYMYWLYSGSAQLHGHDGKFVSNVTCGSGYNGLMGELQFAQLLDSSSNVETPPTPKIKAGGTGATMIRINNRKLKDLMDQDEELSESIKSLLVKGMHEKLSALMTNSHDGK